MQVKINRQFEPVIITLESFEELNTLKNVLSTAQKHRQDIEAISASHRGSYYSPNFPQRNSVEYFAENLLEKLRGIN